MRFGAIIFDKDGTLLDFDETWDQPIFEAILTESDSSKQLKIAEALGFDLSKRTTLPNAPIIHQSVSQLVELLSPLTDGRSLLDLVAQKAKEHVTAVPAADCVLQALHHANIQAAVATNDEEAAARAQMRTLGWLEDKKSLIAAVIGCDSGHGAKPDPKMIQAAASSLGVPVHRCAMIGDSAADLLAGKRAGVMSVILVGKAEKVGHHSHLADFWIEDLGDLLTEHQLCT